MRPIAFGLFTILAASACGKKSSSSSTETPATEKTVVAGQSFSPLYLTQKTNAATPKGFKKTTSLTLANESDICGTTFPEASGVRPNGYYTCMAAYNVREQFFQRGPVVITNRLESVDTRLNEYVSRLSDFKIPCLDPTHTAASTESVTSGSGSADAEVPAYALAESDIATTFSDGHTLDFGRKYHYSCSNSFESAGGTFNILLGKKADTWYLGEVQTVPASSDADIPFLKTMMSLDAEENLEVIFGIAGTSLGKSTATNPESGTYASINGTGNIYSGSAGLAQFIVRPLENIVGASALLNNGCEQRLVMNDKAVYVEVNGNNYGVCFANDIWVADSGYTGPAFSTARATAKGCLKVSGSVPEPMTDLTLCEESGLLVANEAGTGYEDPFARYGIFKLSADTANPPTGGYALRAYHGSRLAPDLGKDANTLQLVSYPAESKVEYSDYSLVSQAFEKSSTSSDSDAGKVTAACNAAEATREVTYTQKAEYAVQTWVDMILAQPDPSDPTIVVDATTAVDQINNAFLNTGDAAPRVATRVMRTVGATFHGLGTGTATLKYNDTVIGTATVDQTDLASDKGQVDVTITFSTIPVVEATGKFTLEYSGKTRLVCNNSTSTTRTANTHMGLATLQFYSKPAEDPVE